MQFAEFMQQRHTSLLRFAGALCADPRLADEVVSDALGIAFEHWDRIVDLEYPYAYVRKIVLNEYLSWRRRSARTAVRSQLPEHADTDSSIADHAEATTDRQLLADELRRLPHKQRAAIVLRYFEGLPFSEIAEILGSGENAVRSNISRGLGRLRVQLEPGESADPPDPPTRLLAVTTARTQA